MRALPPLDFPRLLLSFDFDGTLHEPRNHSPVPAQFFSVLTWMRETYQAVWGINTGRSKEHLIEGLIEARFPFLPDWIITSERDIFYPNNFGRFVPHETWNRDVAKKMSKLFKKMGKDLHALRNEIELHTDAQWLDVKEEPAGLIAAHAKEMEIIMPIVMAMKKKYPDLGWQKNDIYLRFGHKDFHKGSSMHEVARRYGLTTDHIFSAGDGQNDTEMLSPQYAKYRACPANAHDEIKQLLITTGGIVSTQPYCSGVIAALDIFFNHP